ncbi:MAG: T9SS type A sorting domain-containing protein [Ignavibacteriales bacterium]|nr:T9SS type A sorting domain-containing protein [Ignavibacteriales bacterium]
MSKSISWLIACFALLASRQAGSQTIWMKYTGNPIMDVGPSGAWDGRAAAPTRVILEDSVYKMWYTGWDGSANFLYLRTGYATSPNGITWTKHSNNPVLSYGPALWDGSVASHGYVLHTASGYKMWYFGEQSSVRRIGYASSENGITWTKYVNNPLLDVGPPGSWDERALIYPSVLGPDSVGAYKMWFYGFNAAGTQRIGYAIATNESTWTKHPGNPVLNVSGSWDAVHAGYPRVIYDGGTYKMWYSGSASGSAFRSIGYATSPDGIIWTKWPQNPVFQSGQAGSWDAVRVHAGEVMSDGNLFRMWYWGYDGANFRTGYAVSPKEMSVSVLPARPSLDRTKDIVRVIVRIAGPQPELSFSVEVESPRGTPVDTIDLFDDGIHGDSLASDGLFANSWIPGDKSSYYFDLHLALHDTLRFEEMDTIAVFNPVTLISDDETAQPRLHSLDQNYPNPFNPSTEIQFSLPQKSHVTLTIFDLLGREVTTLVSEELSAGSYSTRWNAAGLPSGVYFYRLSGGDFVETKKLLLLR